MTTIDTTTKIPPEGIASETTVEWVCTDCFNAITTDDTFANHLRDPYAHEQGVLYYTPGAPVDCDLHGHVNWHLWSDHFHDQHAEQCETETSSLSQCDGCGTTLAGTRHAVMVERLP